jgi:hypothetical protein
MRPPEIQESTREEKEPFWKFPWSTDKIPHRRGAGGYSGDLHHYAGWTELDFAIKFRLVEVAYEFQKII